MIQIGINYIIAPFASKSVFRQSYHRYTDRCFSLIADNDIQMIRYAGLGVAMANSSEKLLREADYVTRSNNEDGIAVVLEKIIKGEEII